MTEKNLQPIGKVLADSWHLYRKHMNVFGLISVIPFLFTGVTMALGPYLYDFGGFPVSLAASALLAVFGLLYLVFAIVLPFALTLAIAEADRGEMPDFNKVYKRAFSSIIPYLFVIFLQVIVVIGGSILFLIPGIIASIYVNFALYTYILEGKSGISALITSAWYVRNFWWDILARKITLAVILVILMIVFVAIVGPIVFIMGFSAAVFQFLFSLFVFLAVLPFSMIFYYRVYKDVKHAQAARGNHDVPTKAFEMEAEKFFIIFIVVAAIAAVGLFLLVSLISGSSAGFNPQIHGRMMPYYQYQRPY